MLFRGCLIVLLAALLCSCMSLHRREILHIENFLSPRSEIAGTWSKSMLFNASFLTIAAQGERYTIEFGACGCVGETQTSTTATYSGGVIRLATPVDDYTGVHFDRLFVIRNRKRTYLVPDVHVRSFFDEINKSRGHVIDEWTLNMHVYRLIHK